MEEVAGRTNHLQSTLPSIRLLSLAPDSLFQGVRTKLIEKCDLPRRTLKANGTTCPRNPGGGGIAVSGLWLRGPPRPISSRLGSCGLSGNPSFLSNHLPSLVTLPSEKEQDWPRVVWLMRGWVHLRKTIFETTVWGLLVWLLPPASELELPRV